MGEMKVATDGWMGLRRAVRDLAEGYAGTDPANAYRYREEAVAYLASPRPVDDDEFAARQREADALRQTWAARLRLGNRP